MSPLASLALVTAAWLVLLITPGPDFAATVHRATTVSRREGVLVGLGVSAGLAVWSTGSLLGLAVLLATASWLYDLLRLCGAAYLAYLGVRAILGASRPVGAVRAGRAGNAWWVGFLTDIANPKAAAFFGSLFTALLPPDASPWLGAAAVGIVVATAAGWYGLVACVFAAPPVAAAYRRAKRWIDYATGGVFLLLGGRLATAR
jgi:threonine/homoserine/homoserine lactone efflux protein